jgi:hypothetical protein
MSELYYLFIYFGKPGSLGCCARILEKWPPCLLSRLDQQFSGFYRIQSGTLIAVRVRSVRQLVESRQRQKL